MGWTYCVVWFLGLSVSESWQLLDSEPIKHAEVHSPQYPQPYPPNLLKQWDLWVPEGYQIQLNITHLDIKASLDCHQDSLTVLFNQKVLGKFCGQENSTELPGIDLILSPGNRLTLIFQTSDFNPEFQQHNGFSATHKAIDIDECSKPDLEDGSGPLCSQICLNTPGSYRCSCHSGYKLQLDQRTCLLSCSGCILDEHEGQLSSPGYPYPSPPNLSCKYIISVKHGFTITLSFTDNFHIESVDTQQGPRCLHHWLQVTVPGREPMKLCGRESPGVIVTSSNTVRLNYHTDNVGLSHGWSLDYSAQAIDCGEPEPLLNGGFNFLSGFQNQYGSVIQYYCNAAFDSLPWEKNVIFTCEADGKWRSELNSVLPTCFPVCGRPTKLIPAPKRIIGRGEAPENTIPWHVLLSINGQKGGGMVIADSWIMTAASVLTHSEKPVSNKAVQVYMGLTDVKSSRLPPVNAASVYLHPEYNITKHLDYNNDIALIKLQDPITFNSAIMPICLPDEGTTSVSGSMGLVSGFGLVEADKNLTSTNKLNYAVLPVVEQEVCSASISLLKKKWDNVPSLTNKMFCAGVPGGGKDSCRGDHGGPFALEDDGIFWAAGIVSWGVDCGQQGTYRVYTRVANHIPWIKKTIQEN